MGVRAYRSLASLQRLDESRTDRALVHGFRGTPREQALKDGLLVADEPMDLGARRVAGCALCPLPAAVRRGRRQR